MPVHEADIRKLFNKIDKAKLGFLDEKQLSDSNFTRFDRETARKLVFECDQTLDRKVTFDEFKEFIRRKDEELRDLYEKLKGNSPKLRVSQLKTSIKNAGINISDRDFDQFLSRCDIRNGVIEYNDWRDLLLFIPHKITNLQTVFEFNHSVADVDFNSDSHAIPNKISQGGFFEQFKYLLCGGVAGVVSRTATAPLDRLKVLLQTSTRTHRSFSQIVSIKKGIQRIYNDGGILGFFRGNGLNVLKIIPESALKFYAFEHAKDFLSKAQDIEKDQLQIGSRLLAGGMAGLVSQFAIYPIETVKTRTMAQIANRPKNPKVDILKVEREVSVLNTIKNLYKTGGIRAFYRGVTPALIGIIPYAGVDLAVFETLKSTWAAMRPEETKMPIPVMLCSGMFSGTCGAVLMYPLALVRTRMQAQGTPSHPTFYTNTADVVRKTYAQEGVVGFYRGLAPTLMKVLPAVSISYVVYENMKSSLGIS